MRLLLAVVLSLAPGIPAFANPVLVRETEALSPADEQAALTVPDGFEIKLFASEPLINKPINLAHDSRGRLWVSSTVEYPYAARKDRWIDPEGSRVRDSRDAIKILEDTDGDGVADKVTDFADGLNIPTGVLPWHKPEHKDGCIAWSIPNIWYFADTTGDGRADHREVLFGPLGWEKDTHGMCSSFRLGPDGWVYATHGFNNTSHFEARDGSTLDLQSGNVFRFRPDGERIEIWSRGQVNPFGLCFDRRGNLYSADCHSAPVYQLLQGAVYPSFGKPHDGLGFGPAMIEHTHGSTGICGIAYLDRGVWGAEWNDHVLIGNPVTSRVNHDRIEFAGSTPRAIEQPDFITSSDPWFRPVDLCLGGDGALYIADFYNRIIGHYEVPLDHPGRDRERGRIWRVVKKGKTSWAGPLEIPVLSATPIRDLQSDSPFLRRAAVTHFQFAPELEALPLLIDLQETTLLEDTHLRHVLRMAIRSHLKLPGAFEKVDPELVSANFALAVPTAGAAAFLVRHVEANPAIPPAALTTILTHIARHGSSDAVATAIAHATRNPAVSVLDQAALLDALARGQEERGVTEPNPALLTWAQELASRILGDEENPSWIAVPHPDDSKSASPWTLQERRCRDGRTAKVISSLPGAGGKAEQLTGILRSQPFPAPSKLTFWICGHRGPPDQPAHEKNFVRLVKAASGEELRRAAPPRNDVCQPVEWDLTAIANQPVRLEIVDGDRGNAYSWLGVTRFEPAVAEVRSFQSSAARAVALRQLATLLKVTAPADLRDQLRPYLPPASAPPPPAISPQERQRLDALIKARVAGFKEAKPDARKGGAIFETHCAVCHKVAGAGGFLGPQLDGIGSRGVARLCEDILDPNRNVDAHFYLTTLTLADGSSTAGFIRGESGAVLDIVDAAGAPHRVPKKTITARETTALSFMPAAFGKVLSPSELNDLLAWLLTK